MRFPLVDRSSSPGKGRDYSLCRNVQTGLTFHPACRPVGRPNGTVFPGVKQLEREADYSPLCIKLAKVLRRKVSETAAVIATECLPNAKYTV